MNTIITIARLTFREAIRRKIVVASLVLGVAFLVLYGVGFHFIQVEMNRPTFSGLPPQRIQEQAYNFMLMAGLYAVDFLCLITAALITADSLAGEIQSGTIQAVVTKPIRRSEVVLGKWLGNAWLLLLYVLLLGGGIFLLVWTEAQYPVPRWASGLALIYFNCLILMSLTLAFSSTLSTLATGGAVFGAFGLAFIGGWLERIGTVIQNQTVANLGILSSLLLPTEAVWSKAAFQLASPLISLIGANPFTSGSEPSVLMLVYAGIYLLVALLIAIRQFGTRDL